MASTGLSQAAPQRGRATSAWPLPQVWPRGQAILMDWLPALPLLALAVALLVAPTVMVVGYSFRGDTGAWTLHFWAETLGRRGDRQAIVTSLSLAVACATISLLVGAPLAWWIARASHGARASWLSLLNVSANFGGIGLAFGFTASLGAYGMITLLLQQAGIDLMPPSPASFGGLLIAYVYTNVPLFVLLTLPAMGVVQQDMVEAAATLGASTRETTRFIGLPLLAPFLAAGWLLIFTWSIGVYGVAFALAGNAVNGQVRLMTLQIGIALNSATSTPERAAVMATLLLLIAALSLVAYRLIVRRAVRWLA